MVLLLKQPWNGLKRTGGIGTSEVRRAILDGGSPCPRRKTSNIRGIFVQAMVMTSIK